MLQRRLFLTGCVLMALLGLPREGKAGIVEVIIEMSGPQMVGGMSGCLLSTELKFHHCSILGFPVHKKPKTGGGEEIALGWPPSNDLPRTWFILQSGTYFSTGKDADNATGNFEDSNFKIFRVGMVTADPMVAFGIRKNVYVAAGVSYNFLFSKNFEPVHNFGIKLRPVVVKWLGLEWEYNLRLYANGFEVVPGSDPAVLVKGEDFEAVHGISVSMPLF